MRPVRIGTLLGAVLGVSILTATAGVSQTGTSDPPAAAPPPPLPDIPGITVLPPLGGPAGADRGSGAHQGGGQPDQPAGCQFRNNKLELIV